MMAGIWCYVSWRTKASWSPETAGAGGLALVFLVLWIFRFTAEWVRIPADAYGERLAESVDTVNEKKPAAKSAKKD